MVIDTSALVAIFRRETERGPFLEAIDADPRCLLSAASLLEATMVLEGHAGEAGGREVDLFIHRAKIAVVAVDAEQVDVARSAWRRFGKGRHRAGLNFGDCFSYALAMVSGEPILFKGGDFAQTDVVSAV